MPKRTIYISAITNKLLQDETDLFIKKYSVGIDIDINLIKAIIKVESDNNVFAFRYEQSLEKASWYVSILSDTEKKSKYSYCSYGLMQILFAVAKHSGFTGNPIELFIPANNILYGVKLLSELKWKYKSIPDVISAYNQGTNAKNKDGTYKNQGYTNKVLKAMCPYYDYIR